VITVIITSSLKVTHKFQLETMDEEAFVDFVLNNSKFLTQAPRDGKIVLIASEQSLELIKDLFLNVPITKNLRTSTWTGEIATFILENLRAFALDLSETQQVKH